MLHAVFVTRKTYSIKPTIHNTFSFVTDSKMKAESDSVSAKV